MVWGWGKGVGGGMSAWFVSVKTHGRVPQIYDRESWCGELAVPPC